MFHLIRLARSAQILQLGAQIIAQCQIVRGLRLGKFATYVPHKMASVEFVCRTENDGNESGEGSKTQARG